MFKSILLALSLFLSLGLSGLALAQVQTWQPPSTVLVPQPPPQQPNYSIHPGAPALGSVFTTPAPSIYSQPQRR